MLNWVEIGFCHSSLMVLLIKRIPFLSFPFLSFPYKPCHTLHLLIQLLLLSCIYTHKHIFIYIISIFSAVGLIQISCHYNFNCNDMLLSLYCVWYWKFPIFVQIFPDFPRFSIFTSTWFQLQSQMLPKMKQLKATGNGLMNYGIQMFKVKWGQFPICRQLLFLLDNVIVCVCLCVGMCVGVLVWPKISTASSFKKLTNRNILTCSQ